MNAIYELTNVQHPTGATVTTADNQPTANIELNLGQLRRLIKSASRSRDAELTKLERLHPGALQRKVKDDYDVLSEVLVELENACDELVAAMP